jgi:hypothetical protein
MKAQYRVAIAGTILYCSAALSAEKNTTDPVLIFQYLTANCNWNEKEAVAAVKPLLEEMVQTVSKSSRACPPITPAATRKAHESKERPR